MEVLKTPGKESHVFLSCKQMQRQPEEKMSALGATSLPIRIYIKETSLCPRNTCSEIKYNKQTDVSQPKSLLLTGHIRILRLLLWQFCFKTRKIQIPSGKCSVDFILHPSALKFPPLPCSTTKTEKIHPRVRTGKTISLAFSFRTRFHCSVDTRVSYG